jgi:hypothetical protein
MGGYSATLPHVGTSSENNRTITPDFILMRSVTRSVGHLDDRNKLYALKHANIPSVNSLHSCYLALERGWMFGELKLVTILSHSSLITPLPTCWVGWSN